jgi:CheY-like chemotaxis protein
MSKKIILCVDDEKVVLNSLMGQLNMTFGNAYSYEAVSGPEEAWEYLTELEDDGKKVDLIICDWLMPGVRGDEFLIQVKKKYPNTRLIMLSGQADPESVERARQEAKLNAFVSKPWEKEELMGKVHTLLAVAN